MRRTVLATIAVLAAACGATSTPTTSGTTATTATTATSPAATTPPATAPATPTALASCAAPPTDPVPTGATYLADSCLVGVVIDAGGSHYVDGGQILAAQYTTAPACAGFGSQFTWQVTSTPQASITASQVVQGVTTTVGSGASGGPVSGYCGSLQFDNPSSYAVTLDIRYLFYDCTPAGAAC